MLLTKSTSLESESADSETSSVSICLNEASGRCAFFGFRHTFAKWLRLPQFRHFAPHAGHFSFLSVCSPPQNKHVFRFPFDPGVLSVLWVLFLESRCRILFTSSVSVPEGDSLRMAWWQVFSASHSSSLLQAERCTDGSKWSNLQRRTSRCPEEAARSIEAESTLLAHGYGSLSQTIQRVHLLAWHVCGNETASRVVCNMQTVRLCATKGNTEKHGSTKLTVGTDRHWPVLLQRQRLSHYCWLLQQLLGNWPIS